MEEMASYGTDVCSVHCERNWNEVVWFQLRAIVVIREQ